MNSTLPRVSSPSTPAVAVETQSSRTRAADNGRSHRKTPVEPGSLTGVFESEALFAQVLQLECTTAATLSQPTRRSAVAVLLQAQRAQGPMAGGGAVR
jgi:hypothetical protein